MSKSKKNIIDIRQEASKKAILEQLRKIPVIQICCERVGISRQTFYRYRDSDEDFRKAVAEAVAEGEAFITDLSEGQLISMVRDKNFQAVQLWLRKHHHRYADKVEISGEIEHKEKRELSPEEKELIKKALRLALPQGEISRDTKQKSAEKITIDNNDNTV